MYSISLHRTRKEFLKNITSGGTKVLIYNKEYFYKVGFHMLKTGSFWKPFFTVYLALVAGIWRFVEAYTYFKGDTLKQLLGSNWWLYYYVLPLFIAFSIGTLRNAKEETPTETLDQRNRRVMLDHVENFWVKGVLEKSLHGAALLEIGIKEDPGAVNYPWIIKRESTNETLPAGKSMLEIFTSGPRSINQSATFTMSGLCSIKKPSESGSQPKKNSRKRSWRRKVHETT